MKPAVTVFLLLLVSFLVAPVYASNVTIKVKSIFYQPLEGVYVLMDGTEGFTDTNGSIVFENVEAGNHSLRIVREGRFIHSSVLVQNIDVKKTFTIMTGDDWALIGFLGLFLVVVVALIFLLSRRDKRKPYDPQTLRGKRWDRR